MTTPALTTTGSITPATASTTTTAATVPTAEAELDAAIRHASESVCYEQNTTADLLSPVDGGDLAVDSIGLFGRDENGAFGRDDQDITVVFTGTIASRADVVWWPFTTSEDLASLHSALFFNHQRALMSLSIFADVFQEIPVAASADTSVIPPENLYAVWDGLSVEYIEAGEVEELSAIGLLRTPQEGLDVGSEARSLMWSRIEDWLGGLVGAGFDPDPYDWRAVTVLEGSSYVDSAVPLLCVALATEWKVAADESSQILRSDLRDDSSVFYREIAIQELLLLTEYLQVLDTYLSESNVDWLRADNIDEAQNAADGITSASEYTFLFHFAALDALNTFRVLELDAWPLNS